MENSDININIVPQEVDKSPWYARSLKWYIKSISDTSFLKILKVIFVTIFFLAAALASFYAFASTSEVENIRDFVVTPKIQHELEILVYSLNAERAFVFELHN